MTNRLKIITQQSMQNCITYISLAPARYLNDLKNVERSSWTMKGTTFYPAFPIAVILGWLSILGLSAYLLAFFIINDQLLCYQHIKFGVIALAALYPLEATYFFICAVGSAALSYTDCWKVTVVVLLGLIIGGFSFGGLGFIYICILGSEHTLLIHVSFLQSNTFIQIMIYTYLGFLVLYLILLPLLTCAYNAQDDPLPENRGCCFILCCIIYYFFQFIFLVTALFMIVLKLIGAPLLIYVLVQILRSAYIDEYSWFLALVFISLLLPIVSFLLIYFFSNCFHLNTVEEKEEEQKKDETQLEDSSRQREIVFLGTQPSKGFGEDRYQIGNDQL